MISLLLLYDSLSNWRSLSMECFQGILKIFILGGRLLFVSLLTQVEGCVKVCRNIEWTVNQKSREDQWIQRVRTEWKPDRHILLNGLRSCL